MLSVKRGLFGAAAAVGIGLVLAAAKALWGNQMPYRFEGYEYTATTRLGVLSITNLGSCSVEFGGRAEVHFADGWHPRWGDLVVIRSGLTISGKKSGKWVFEVPPHEAKWKVTCVLQKHTFMEAVASRFSSYRVLSWTQRLGRPRTTTFASDWVSE
jgi:hypothetical protein